MYYPRTVRLALPPSSNSDPTFHSGPSPPSPLRYMPLLLSREFSIFFPRRLARVELSLPTQLGALSTVDPFSAFLRVNSKYHHSGN